MDKKRILIGGTVLLLLTLGCNSGGRKDQVIEFDSVGLSEKNIPLNPLDTLGEGLPIFYNMYLSVELSSLFETAGAVFDADLMNSVGKTSEYLTSSQQAINLGVYAVDLSYARVFDQVEVAGKYFNAMKQMSQELGIPADYFENTVKRFERNFTNKDSIIYLANEVYMSTESYLQENERYTTAALIILGGWVEAINIATQVAVESKDLLIIERLVEQKYSLNNLVIMLSEHMDNEVVKGYMPKIDRIKGEFNKINIAFDLDAAPNSAKGKALVQDAITQLHGLQSQIGELRNEIIH